MKTKLCKNVRIREAVATLVLLLASIICLWSCTGEENDMDKSGGVVMTAKIKEIGEYVVVEVLESEYTFGEHWVITSEETDFVSLDGKKITRADLRQGDTVDILYSGQVMLSYPPKIVAWKITLK